MTRYWLTGAAVLIIALTALALTASTFARYGGKGFMLFGAQASAYTYRLYLLDMSSGHLQPLTDNQSLTLSDGAASWSPEGMIAFMSSDTPDRDENIYSWRFPHRVGVLDNTPGDDLFPLWSPDGSKLAFASKRDGTWRLYVMNAPSDTRPLAIFNGSSWDMAWSPDSARLAFTASERYPDDQEELVIADPSTGMVERITHNDLLDSSPEWSPDGTQLVWHSGDFRRMNLLLYDLPTGQTRDLTRQDGLNYSPAWSPDGRWIAYVSVPDGVSSQIQVIDVDSGHTRELTQSGTSEIFPVWSPDSSEVAFVSDRDGRLDLYAIHVESGNIRRLTEMGTIDLSWQPQWIP